MLEKLAAEFLNEETPAEGKTPTVKLTPDGLKVVKAWQRNGASLKNTVDRLLRIADAALSETQEKQAGGPRQAPNG